MSALGDRIAALIAAQGPISIAQFMSMANGAYYAAGDPLGREGDFITAPEISQVFGELLGLWCVQVWHDQGRCGAKRLVELGPGRGTLMADALRAARVAPEFLDGLEIVLVESSPALGAMQQERLGEWGGKIRWLEQFDSSLGDRPLFLLANEFFDALPIRQYVKTAHGWCERMVGAPGGKLAFVLSPVPVPDSAIPPDRADAPDGGVCEICPSALSLAEEIGRIVAIQGGGALIVDYGYDSPDFGETLQAVEDHSFAGILDEPGESDLSAHVDFSNLAAAASRAAVFGPTTQAEFLDDIGIVRRFEQLAMRNSSAATELWSQLDRLVNPDQMGTLFKALAIVPRTAPKPPGF